ncbi:short-chain dehydrogenase [Haloarcula rubripromontorii]|uniref:Short-chain dehydrogenase n=1 Tax=Haloarcula rubripromontorii TaxID=1705562 RepID=A0A0M9ALM4_9EURY|nr:SDR family oxidoreductase [Haloarcula rubripromontorii]KOX94008.1 short-chain dehydrogenase [Haloarcula rubripromontorii]
MNRFADDVAIVTGSTRGIGAGVAERLAAEGASVVVSGRSEDDGSDVVETIREAGGSAHFVRADMRDPADIETLVEATVAEFGGLDVLVNNAGVETYTGADEATIDDWSFVVETDFRAFWLAAKHAYEHMDEGAIVNMSSNHSMATTPDIFPYNAVKAGINGMTRAMAVDFGPQVRVNTVAPGWVEVDRTTGDMDEERRRELEGIHPTGRLGSPEDVAGAVAFVASDDAEFVTGSTITVDGGRAAVLQDDFLPDYREER